MKIIVLYALKMEEIPVDCAWKDALLALSRSLVLINPNVIHKERLSEMNVLGTTSRNSKCCRLRSLSVARGETDTRWVVLSVSAACLAKV